MTATDKPAVKARCEADTRAWEFLIDTSKVAFDSIAVFTSETLATWGQQSSQPPLNPVST